MPLSRSWLGTGRALLFCKDLAVGMLVAWGFLPSVFKLKDDALRVELGGVY